ncbi:MAG: hypothetical protein KKB81_00230 [Candidatus Margulisbacteria bacterium]|nr:hypothetical protein [Candidatus Margulisiibacteriota bacterium]MBU1022382.1 hypothetical protein [Candidatus Margulisiibacteriota bacterium]MBU1729066.1 hypothetical protein [Candidatus Margulisiibacteriota bacterium]MBU1954513.1 hypothetical protein [Candidatus Margulisiibacteriota bacterium]
MGKMSVSRYLKTPAHPLRMSRSFGDRLRHALFLYPQKAEMVFSSGREDQGRARFAAQCFTAAMQAQDVKLAKTLGDLFAEDLSLLDRLILVGNGKAGGDLIIRPSQTISLEDADKLFAASWRYLSFRTEVEGQYLPDHDPNALYQVLFSRVFTPDATAQLLRSKDGPYDFSEGFMFRFKVAYNLLGPSASIGTAFGFALDPSNEWLIGKISAAFTANRELCSALESYSGRSAVDTIQARGMLSHEISKLMQVTYPLLSEMRVRGDRIISGRFLGFDEIFARRLIDPREFKSEAEIVGLTEE